MRSGAIAPKANYDIIDQLEERQKTKRYSSIEVAYLDRHFKKKKQTFKGVVAQVIQHEMDHCEGILI